MAEKWTFARSAKAVAKPQAMGLIYSNYCLLKFNI